jgi:hypothetical protein
MAGECARLYGKDRQVAAGVAEIINVIGRGGLVPQDWKKLSTEQIKGALPSFLFYKAKDLLPDEKDEAMRAKAQQQRDSHPDQQPWTEVRSKRQKRAESLADMIKIKGRWVGGGNHQNRSATLKDKVAPTARGVSHALLLAIAALENRQLHVIDIPSAYLQAEYKSENGKDLYIRADKETTSLILLAYPDLQPLVRPDGTMILRVALALYGLVESAWLWYKELVGFLTTLGYEVLDADKGLVAKRVYKGDTCIGSNFASLHVDDILSVPSNNQVGQKLAKEFVSSLEGKWPGIKHQHGERFTHLSWDIRQDRKTGIITRSQGTYLREVVKELGVTRK